MAKDDDEDVIPRPNLRRYYGRELADLTPGEFQWRIVALRGGRTRPLRIDSIVESLSWGEGEGGSDTADSAGDDGNGDTAEGMTGEITLRRLAPHVPTGIGIGHSIALDVRWGGRWLRLWTMRCSEPSVETGPGESQESIELTDDLSALLVDTRDWSYRKTKKRGRGWFAHEITRDVAKVCGVRPGRIVKGREEIDSLKRERTSGLAIIVAAWTKEKAETRLKYRVRLRDGRLDVQPLRRNDTLYVIRDRQVTGASPVQVRKQKPTTVLIGTGRVGKGKGAKKVRHREARPQIVARMGRREREKDYGRVKSAADLRKRVREDYAKDLRVTRTAEVSIPGVPFLRRGDGVRWITREPGWRGATEDTRDRSFAYLTSTAHSLESGSFTTEVSLTQEDPYSVNRAIRSKELREQARQRRDRRRAARK